MDNSWDTEKCTFLVEQKLEGWYNHLRVQEVDFNKESVHFSVIVRLRALSSHYTEHPHDSPARLHNVSQEFLCPDVSYKKARNSCKKLLVVGYWCTYNLINTCKLNIVNLDILPVVVDEIS